MIISDEIEGLAFFLQLDGRFHHAEIVAQMKRARGLDADKIRISQNSHETQKRKEERGSS